MEKEFEEVVSITGSIARLENHLRMLRDERRDLIILLRKKKVTARKLSDALGMSEQNVHKIVKGK